MEMKEKHVVIIYPHPDDESFGSAGTIAKFRKANIPVTYLCGTLGEMGRNMGNPLIANREALPRIRHAELEEACRILDIDLQVLGYRDKTIEFEDINKVAEHLKGVIETIDPSLVITFDPIYGVHPDHNALGKATIEALKLISPDKRPKLWVRPVTVNYREMLGEADFSFDIEAYFDEKMAAIGAHHSQADGILGEMLKKAHVSTEVRKKALEVLGKEEYYTWNFDK